MEHQAGGEASTLSRLAPWCHQDGDEAGLSEPRSYVKKLLSHPEEGHSRLKRVVCQRAFSFFRRLTCTHRGTLGIVVIVSTSHASPSTRFHMSYPHRGVRKLSLSRLFAGRINDKFDLLLSPGN